MKEMLRAALLSVALIAISSGSENKNAPPRDYSEANQQCDHSEKTEIMVSVGGGVMRTKRYKLKASDSVWRAVEAAGGLSPRLKFKHIDVTRLTKEGELKVFLIEVPRRADEVVPLLLCDGDIVTAEPQ